MACGGVQKAVVGPMTAQFRGVYKDDASDQDRFLTLVRNKP